MYKVIFTAILVAFTVRKLWRLVKNRRQAGNFAELDENLLKRLNEGEFHG